MNDISFSAAPAMPEPPAVDYSPSARRAYNRVGLGMLVFLLLPLAVSLVVQLVAMLFFPEYYESSLFLWFNQIFSMYLVTAPICLLVIGVPPANMPVREKRTMPFSHLFVIFCIMEMVAVAGSWLSQLLMSLVSLLSGREHVSPLDEILSGAPLWVIFLVVVVIGPIVEELVCRAAIMRRLLPYGEKSAILVSAICFGVMHENFYQLFYAVGVGILLGYVYARTGRLLYVCGLHILFNFLGSFIPMLVMQFIDVSMLETLTEAELLPWIMENLLPFLGLLLYDLVLYGLALAGLILLIVFCKRARFEPTLLPLRKGKHVAACLGNPGAILFLIAGVAMLVLSIFIY